MQHEGSGCGNGHFQKPTREVGYTKIQEFSHRTRQVQIIVVNISFCEEKQKVGLFVCQLEGFCIPLQVHVQQFGNHRFKGCGSCHPQSLPLQVWQKHVSILKHITQTAVCKDTIDDAG